MDEAGRGPLAGPVVAAAVVLDPERPIAGLDDSKRLTKRQRERLHERITQQARAVGLGMADREEIDRMNILQATLVAMSRAVAALKPESGLEPAGLKPNFVLVDGNHLPDNLPCQARAVVRGDRLCDTIAAASVVAKVRRDALMLALSREYPAYGWERNNGYPTRHHLNALANYGVTPHHRRSFAPVRRYQAALVAAHVD